MQIWTERLNQQVQFSNTFPLDRFIPIFFANSVYVKPLYSSYSLGGEPSHQFKIFIIYQHYIYIYVGDQELIY